MKKSSILERGFLLISERVSIFIISRTVRIYLLDDTFFRICHFHWKSYETCAQKANSIMLETRKLASNQII